MINLVDFINEKGCYNSRMYSDLKRIIPASVWKEGEKVSYQDVIENIKQCFIDLDTNLPKDLFNKINSFNNYRNIIEAQGNSDLTYELIDLVNDDALFDDGNLIFNSDDIDVYFNDYGDIAILGMHFGNDDDWTFYIATD